MLFPVIGQTLVKFTILLIRDVIRVSHPQRLGFVQLLKLRAFLLDLFLLLIFFLFSFFVFIKVLNFWLVFILILLFGFFLFFLIVRNFFVTFFLDQQGDGVSNKLAVFLDDFLDSLLLHVLKLVLFHVKDDFGTPAQTFPLVHCDSE